MEIASTCRNLAWHCINGHGCANVSKRNLYCSRMAGLRKLGYPGAIEISPSYMHALIEAGNEIQALRILGKPSESEPGFYGWLRGLALYRAGDFAQASKAFSLHFSKWPGDVLGAAITDELVPNG